MVQDVTWNGRTHTFGRYVFVIVAHVLLTAGASTAQQILEDVRLVDVRVSALSDTVDTLAFGTGFLSDGSSYSFDRYYSSNWVDLRFTLLSPINENLGIYWGFGTGERGAKYQIDPSLTLGFISTRKLTEYSLLSLSVKYVLGGYLKEDSCTADFGAIGGIQEVNCRLASSPLPPAETLEFLLNEPPEDQLFITLRYQFWF